MNKELQVLISILNWNNAEDTIKTIKSIHYLNYKNYKIIITDNASTDNSIELLNRTFPNIKIKINKTNLGYAGGHQFAANYAIKNKFDALWILNNDIIVKENSLTALIEAYKVHKNAIYGSITLKPDGLTINYGGAAEMIDKKTIDRNSGYNHLGGKNYEEYKNKMKTRIISDINGASILFPIEIIKKYGFIDTRWFLYGEETDYCYTLRRKYGISSIIVPSSVIIHEGSASFKKNPKLILVKNYYFTRNINILYKKHFKDYKITGYGSFLHLIKFFVLHYLHYKKHKNIEYYKSYYTKLGQLHSLLRIRGKYIKPEKFIK